MASAFWLLNLADWIVDQIAARLDARNSALVHRDQLERASQSIPSNIREAYGRQKGRDRLRFLGYALASAQETAGHLRANVARRRLSERTYWRLHNRLAVVRKSLETLIAEQER